MVQVLFNIVRLPRIASFSLCIALLVAWLCLGCAGSAAAGDAQAIERYLDAARARRWNEAAGIARRQSGYVRDFMNWYYVRDSQSGASFDSIASFLQSDPDWPDRDMIITRGEQALMGSHSNDVRFRWFSANPPKTAHGKFLFARTLMERGGGKNQQAQELIREAWRSGELDSADQRDLYSQFSSLLTTQDHIAAVDGLLWNDRYDQANRLMEMVPEDYQRLFTARMKLTQGGGGMEVAVKRVPPRLLNDAGFLYARLVWRHKRGMEEGVNELLRMAPSNVPKPELWWKIRKNAVWKKIEERRYKDAYALVRNHGQVEGASFAEAEWFAGWLQYAYLKNPGEAYKHFYKLYEKVQYPVSLSRGAYWAARAAQKHGTLDIATRWYQVAAQYPSTFYGQMALAALSPNATNNLPPPARISNNDYDRFRKRPAAQAALALMEVGDLVLTKRFMDYLIDNARSPAERSLAAQLSTEMSPQMQVKAGKQALQNGSILPELGYPMPSKMPKQVSGERALVLAIIRQESELNPRARSSADAMGLMQLLPSTAAHTAKKMGVGYHKDRLFEPEYNIMVGSYFLNSLVENYGGSYILAIAAYNAGPGRVSGWLKEFGDPRKGEIEPVLWIERIPFTETRNYVHRVLENLVMYRHRLNQYRPLPVTMPQELER
jgi:soluble lytic murein transglycosylase